MKFNQAQFIKTVVDVKEAPFNAHLPEIAVVGRSNVGKSTLLNHLFGSKKMVKTSSSPGKTRALNFFSVDQKLIFVDFPGYGYAKISKQEQATWRGLIEEYLYTRPTLRLLLLLLDFRHPPTEDDLKMLEWVHSQNLNTIVVLTKVDKLNQSQAATQTKLITGMLKELPYVHYSATKNLGRKELIAKISESVGHAS
jgi:GTP-binding protein